MRALGWALLVVGCCVAAGVLISRTLVPEPSALHRGHAHYERGEYAQAEAAYREALEENPDDFNALNNLAWMLATCPDRQHCDPEQAVELAQRAAALNPDDYILDTLATALYESGRIEAAIEVQQRAVAANMRKPESDKRAYLVGRLDRFKAERDRQAPSGLTGGAPPDALPRQVESP